MLRQEEPTVKLSITSTARSTFTVNGVEMSVSTVRIREGNTFRFSTAITCKGATSDGWSSSDKGSALVVHDKIVGFVRGWERDVHSKYFDFVQGAIGDVNGEQEKPAARKCIAPPPSGRVLSIAPGSLQQSTLVEGHKNVFVLPVVRRQATDTIPAGPVAS